MQTLLQLARVRFTKPCSSLIAFIALAFLNPSVAAAQDATTTAPHAYQLQFENKWTRVTRVHYGPREKIPPHAHTLWPAAYVYLNDSGPIIFRHKDWEHPELTRPATTAGSFRLSPTTAVNEIHEVENPTDLPSDFLRVEFKTRPLGRESLHGRFKRENYPASENVRQQEFENSQIRITRLICAPHKSLVVAANSSEPALLIVLSAAILNSDGANNPMLKPGQTIWMDRSQRERFENLGETPLELLRFDLRTAPVEKEKRKKTGK